MGEREGRRAPSSSPGCRTSGYENLVADGTTEECDQDSATKGNDYEEEVSKMATAIKAGQTDDVQRKRKTLQTLRSVCVTHPPNPRTSSAFLPNKGRPRRPPEKPLLLEGFVSCEVTTRSALVCYKSSISSFWVICDTKGRMKYDFFLIRTERKFQGSFFVLPSMVLDSSDSGDFFLLEVGPGCMNRTVLRRLLSPCHGEILKLQGRACELYDP